jgi:UMF1 family MFS transporter
MRPTCCARCSNPAVSGALGASLRGVSTLQSAPEQRRREQRGWVFYDWANSVFPTSVVTVFLSTYLSSVAESDARGNGQPCATQLVGCDVNVLGVSLPAGSLWGYLLSVATVVQVLVLPITGAIVDRRQNKRRMLAGFAFTGAGLTSALALVSGTNWWLGVVLFIGANICFGASVVVYYAFLPEIAFADERDAVSARGWAFGYLGSGVALLGQLGIFLGHDAVGLTEAEAVRVCLFTAGLWWAAFTLIPLRRLRDRRAPEGTERGLALLAAGFTQLRQTLRSARAFPLTLGFLGAYLVYTDGISTVANVSAQYGSAELGFPQNVLITTILIVQFIAFVGGVVHGRVAARIGAKRTIMGSLVLWVVVVGAAYFVQPGAQLQFYGLAVGIGLVLGGTNALSRSLFSQLVPAGKEGEYFSLYEIGERSTSWLGPFLFAFVGQQTGSYRLAIVSLVVFFVAGLVLVSFVPVARAIRAVGNPVPAVV